MRPMGPYKHLDPDSRENLAQLYTERMMLNVSSPTEWWCSDVTVVEKDKMVKEVSVDRTRPLTKTVAQMKVYIKMLVNRSREERWKNYVANQFGGQTGIRPTEAIFCLRMICERATLMAKPLYLHYKD